MSKWFCTNPFMHVTLTDSYRPCCENDLNWKWPENRASFENRGLLEYFHGDEENELRQAFLSDEPRDHKIVQEGCHKCITQEQNGSASRRIRDNKRYGTNTDLKIRTIKFEHYPKCNLKCLMCNQARSSKIELFAKDNPDLIPTFTGCRVNPEPPSFMEDLEKIAPDLEEVYFAGGEPLLNKECEDILEYLFSNKLKPKIYFNTNGTIPANKFAWIVEKFDYTSIAISIDGVEDVDEYIRWGTDWDRKYKNIVEFILMKYENNGRMALTFNPAVQALNAGSITNLVEFAKESKIRCSLSNVVMNPYIWSMRVLPHEIRDKYLAKYEQAPAPDTGEYPIKLLKNMRFNPQLSQQFFQQLRKIDEHRGTDALAVWPEFEKFYLSESTTQI